MKKILLSFAIFFLLTGLFTSTAFAEYMLFTNDNCPHCSRLDANLKESDFYEKFGIAVYEVSKDEQNLALYMKKSEEVGYKSGGVPLLVDGPKFIEGADPIYDYFSAMQGGQPIQETKLTQADANLLDEILKKSTPEGEAPMSSKEFIVIGIVLIFLLLLYRLKTGHWPKE